MKTGPKGPTKWTKSKIEEVGQRMYDFFKNNTSYFLIDFCVQEGISKQRISEFAQSNENFSELLNRCKTICESRLANFMLSARNPTAQIFALKVHHQWDDKQTINMQHSGGININLSYDTITPEDVVNE